jgi:hypothetical protein
VHCLRGVHALLLASLLLGGLRGDRAAIRRVVKTQMPAIIECFERDGLATTRVVVDFTIGRTGKVTSTRTTGTGSPTLHRCVAGAFAKLTFPRPATGPVVVHYPVQICVAGQ